MFYKADSSIGATGCLHGVKLKKEQRIEMHRYSVVYAVIFIITLATPAARSILEQYMLSHVLVQLPLLILCGIWVGCYISDNRQLALSYHVALPLLLVALFTSLFWMLPRVLDASLEQNEYLLAKFIMLPFLLGMPLSLAWKNIGSITKAFVITNVISMLVVLAWLYIEAPVRLCNYYLIDEQKSLGVCLLLVAGAVSCYWFTRLFFIGKR